MQSSSAGWRPGDGRLHEGTLRLVLLEGFVSWIRLFPMLGMAGSRGMASVVVRREMRVSQLRYRCDILREADCRKVTICNSIFLKKSFITERAS